MNEMMRVFSYESNQVRVVEKDGEPWWVLADVCQILGVQNSRDVAKRLDNDEKGVDIIYTPGGNQKMTVVNEPGLYSVILRSDKKEAKEFKRWVTHEVIPSIRKTGQYGAISGETMAQFARLTDCMTRLVDRVEKLEQVKTPPTATSEYAISGPQALKSTSYESRAVRKYWMRQLSLKLDLLETELCMSRNKVLHYLYLTIEKAADVDLTEERMKLCERIDRDCTALETIYADSTLRKFAEKIIDSKLAPEDKGW